MRLRRRFPGVLRALLTATALAACGPTSLRDLTLRPDKHYQDKITVKGRITRTQVVGGETLIEIADQSENRLLVRTTVPVTAGVGDWVRARGVLVPESRVGDATLYDVLTADELTTTRRPWLPRIM
jgi:hypothetical protein